MSVNFDAKLSLDVSQFLSGVKKADEEQLHEKVEDAEGEKKVIADPFVAAVSQAISKTKI